MKKTVILLLFIISSNTFSIPIKISLTNSGIALPFTQFYGEGIGLFIGTEFTFFQYEDFNLSQSFNIGFFHQDLFQQGIILSSDTNIRYTHETGLLGEISGGVGYIHSFYNTDSFKLSSDGDYLKNNDPGRSSFSPSFSVGIGYDFRKTLKKPIVVTFDYKCFFEIPFSEINNIFVLPYIAPGLSLKYLFE